jgi:hypothetical protein
MNFIQTIDFLLKPKLLQREEYVPNSNVISLYFIGLEDNKMFLYPSFTKSKDQIMEDCAKLYEYARVYKPRNVVFTIHDVDLFEIDSIVKLFMRMFGVENTRGGSYVDIDLPEYQKLALDRELFTASEDFLKSNAEILHSS